MLERRSVGVVILTVATLLLLSGLWCIYLSPLAIYGPSDLNTAWYKNFREQHFPPNATVSYSFTVDEGQYVRIWITNVEMVTTRIFETLIRDSENNIVYLRTGTSPIDLAPRKAGQYTLEIRNQPYVETDLTVEIIGYYVTSRPLIPIGQLLILISTPLYGLSIWLIKTTTSNYNSKPSFKRHNGYLSLQSLF